MSLLDLLPGQRWYGVKDGDKWQERAGYWSGELLFVCGDG